MGSPVKKTMLFVLLDESGSMSGKEADVIGSINTLIDDQLKVPEPASMAIAVFGGHIPDMIKFVRPMTPLKDIQKLTPADYRPTGSTPLFEATGRSIQALDNDWVREKPDRCIFATFTDGQNTDHHEFTADKVKKMITAREKSGLWSFLFLGANIDSFTVGATMGYTTNKMSNYTASSRGIRGASATLSHSFRNLRTANAHAFAEASHGIGDIGLGGDIAEDGTVTKVPLADLNIQPQSQSTAKTHIPPTAAMQQEPWTPPTSSALFDPKIEAWKPPV